MAETMGREELERLVEGLEYPISKRTLLEEARQRGASETVLNLIQGLNEGVFASHAALVADMERAIRPE